MRASTFFTIGLGLPALIGCGDDVSGTTDAPATIDARVVDAAPDAPPTPTFKGFDADEGGELRMEYVRFAGGNAGARTTGFLWKDVGSTKFFPFPNLNGCINSSTDMNWPTATNPIAERVYLDPGSIIISGGPNLQTIPRRGAGTDPFGRTHPADKWFFDPATNVDTDGGNFQTEKTKYDVIFTGSADMPAQVFDDVLYSPADFQVTTPGVTPLAIPANTPQTFTWTTPTDTPPAGYMVLSLVAFTGANGPAVLCIEPNDGSITVPAAMIDVARIAYPNGGTLARQTLTHVVRELKDNNGPTGKRIDFVSVWCYATGFTVP